MKKLAFCLLGILVVTAAVSAQSRSFSMIPKPKSAQNSTRIKMEETPEFKKALKVYERLREARGDFRYPVPDFFMTQQKGQVASIIYGPPIEIFLEEAAYNVCASFGDKADAAMAFLLGHELAHYYEKHGWRSDFGTTYSHLGISKQLDTLYRELESSTEGKKIHKTLLRFDTLSHQYEDVAMESQADYLGGFLAYSAGYGLFDDGDELIGRLYDEYGMKPQTAGYVTRSEREGMSKTASERMKTLVDVFEMANMLTAIGRYDDANLFYRYVLMEYQGREMYNNVGVTYLLFALKEYFKEDELKFRFPIQLDLAMATHRGSDEAKERNRLLEQAIQHFDAAISLDPNYSPAYLNKACAYALMDDNTRAYFYADVEGRKAATKNMDTLAINNLEILLGILDYRSGNAAKAKERFTMAKATNKGLAEYNLAKLNNQPLPAPPISPDGFFEDETIDSKDINSILFPPEGQKLQIEANISFHKVDQELELMHSRLLFARRPLGKTTKFLMTNPGSYPGKTSRDIGQGASRTDIVKAYGEPPTSIQTPQGEIMAYRDLGILFIMKYNLQKKDSELERWVLYKEP
ncbi:MAG: tetratricopeptide repeat protein [Saprospiraceae bacterium]|nr:tetratricopeptide repeat protein [Saprospiraceae bacterium]